MGNSFNVVWYRRLILSSSRFSVIRIVFFLCWACLSSSVMALESGVTIEGAWVRAMPPTQRNTAAYLTISNRGDTALTIVGATTDLSGKAEIHTSAEVDGYTHMEQLHTVALPPGQTVQLTPGGMHLMLLDLEEIPAVDTAVRICLQLSSGDPVCAQARVQKGPVSAAGQLHHHLNAK